MQATMVKGYDLYQVTIYPNPVIGKLNISLNNQQNNVSGLRIINKPGQILYNQKIIAGSINTELKLDDRALGLYLIELLNKANQRLSIKQFILH